MRVHFVIQFSALISNNYDNSILGSLFNLSVNVKKLKYF